jgi:lysozyme
MKTSNKGIDLIKKYEGFRAKAYRCSANVLTIGYGHTQNVKPTDVISLDEAEYFLTKDVEFAENEVNRHNLNINQNQFDALVSFVFNLGVGNFARSTLLKKIKSNPNDSTIREEFERWIYAGGKALNGLVRRRREEADLYFTK